jgi:hypothetical protein
MGAFGLLRMSFHRSSSTIVVLLGRPDPPNLSPFNINCQPGTQGYTWPPVRNTGCGRNCFLSDCSSSPLFRRKSSDHSNRLKTKNKPHKYVRNQGELNCLFFRQNNCFKGVNRWPAEIDIFHLAMYGTSLTAVIRKSFCLNFPGIGSVGWLGYSKPKSVMVLMSSITR